MIKPGPLTGLGAAGVAVASARIAIPVNEMNGVAKLINPGDRIDIVAAVDVGKGLSQHREVKTLMQDVTILATGVRVVNELAGALRKNGQMKTLQQLARRHRRFNTITDRSLARRIAGFDFLALDFAGLAVFDSSASFGSQQKTFSRIDDRNASGQSFARNAESASRARRPRAAASAAAAPKKKKKGPFVDL